MKCILVKLSGMCFLGILFFSAELSVAAAVRHGREAMLGKEEIQDKLPFYDGETEFRGTYQVREPREGDAFPPLRILLSRSRYWAQDKHMDVVVQLEGKEEVSRTIVKCRITGEEGQVLSEFDMRPPGERFIFYPRIPGELLNGGKAKIDIKWYGGRGEELAAESEEFRVERFEEPVESSGSIPLRIPNVGAAAENSFPVTVGVPFPRGTLYDTSNLRLVSSDGAEGGEIPMQVNEVARWSRFGSVKWVHVDFTVDLFGNAKELELEYGPGVSRKERDGISFGRSERFPEIHAGRMSFSEGLWFDRSGEGDFEKILEEEGMFGAFVKHEDGKVYRMCGAGEYVVEEAGPEKVVLKREGWYVEEESGQEFCKYLTRYIIHRDSPFVRIFHTWIFTGDGNHDRIANMGWEFCLAEGFEPEGFLSSFDEGGEWLQGDYLLQWDYEHYDLASSDGLSEFPGGRAPGVASAAGNGLRMYFGTKDFWQNYPSELEFSEGSLWFHNWPRHNRAAGYTFEGELITEPGEPAPASAARHEQYGEGMLTLSEWKLNVIQQRFAHEGEFLNFRLPDALTEEPIWSDVTLGREMYWDKGEPESANAQGISRTEEMWLYVTGDEVERTEAENLLRGVNDETVRAVVDPKWMASSGAFYNMRHQDWDTYSEEEHAFEKLALAPGRWREYYGFYGMWLFGDMMEPGRGKMEDLEPRLYRGLRKRHQGWPYSWIPYARSGDPRLLKEAEAATRQNIDANYCHYVCDDLERHFVSLRRLAGRREVWRRKGFIRRATLPWTPTRGAYTRCYESQVDYLLHAWYLTGYHRARDVFRGWADMTKIEEGLDRRGPSRIKPVRYSLVTLESYVRSYKKTFEPWFIVISHALAEGHRHLHEIEDYTGHMWRPALREYLRYTEDESLRELYMAYADSWGSHLHVSARQRAGVPMVESNEFAWRLTGEEYYLKRVSHFLDWLKVAVWAGEEPSLYSGYYGAHGLHGAGYFTAYALRYFASALRAVEDAGYYPEPVSELFQVRDMDPFVVAIEKNRAEPVVLNFRTATWRRSAGIGEYSVTHADGTVIKEGEWDTEEDRKLEIPGDAADGVYKVEVRKVSQVMVPLSECIKVPEVIVAAPGETMEFLGFNQAWFYVPEGLEEFRVSIYRMDLRHHVNRTSIWNPAGERVFDLNYHGGTYTGEEPVEVLVEVDPGHRGKLWRITLPSGRARFQIDDGIPPVYAVDRYKWFIDDELEGMLSTQ